MALIPQFQPGFRLPDGAELNAVVDELNTLTTGAGVVDELTAGTLVATIFKLGVNAAATAHAGGGQANATQLSAGITSVATVATAADSVKLPPGEAGLVCILRNSAANSMQVFGNGTDTIDAVATATGVAQAAGIDALYYCISNQPAAAWGRILSA